MFKKKKLPNKRFYCPGCKKDMPYYHRIGDPYGPGYEKESGSVVYACTEKSCKTKVINRWCYSCKCETWHYMKDKSCIPCTMSEARKQPPPAPREAALLKGVLYYLSRHCLPTSSIEIILSEAEKIAEGKEVDSLTAAHIEGILRKTLKKRPLSLGQFILIDQIKGV